MLYDIHIELKNQPGQLAQLGKLLGTNGISLEGGGMFTRDNLSQAHFLITDGPRAKELLRQNGFCIKSLTIPTIRRLDQETPGQLGLITETLANHEINILTQYSDHSNNLILVTDNPTLAEELTLDWK